MNDTPREIEQRYLSMMAKKTPAERLEMACSMFDTARLLMRAGLEERFGTLNEAHMRGRIFLRMYGDDFSRSALERMAGSIPGMELDRDG